MLIVYCGLLEVDIGRYTSRAYEVHVIMSALILPRNMIPSDIEHVHSGLFFIGASLSEPHIVVISITFSCTSYRRYVLRIRLVCRRSDSV